MKEIKEIFENAERFESVKKINRMLYMQEELDKEILKKKHTGVEKDLLNLRLAILDEIGELNHELKKTWCWWKESQDDVDTMKVWEELIDIWHFVMSGYIDEVKNQSTLNVEEIVKLASNEIKNSKEYEFCSYKYLIWSLIRTLTYDGGFSLALASLIVIGKSLGFDVDDVYYKYMEKNAENYDRLKRGY